VTPEQREARARERRRAAPATSGEITPAHLAALELITWSDGSPEQLRHGAELIEMGPAGVAEAVCRAYDEGRAVCDVGRKMPLLTEAEARAWWPLRDGDSLTAIARLLMAANRGQIPPEVRPLPRDLDDEIIQAALDLGAAQIPRTNNDGAERYRISEAQKRYDALVAERAGNVRTDGHPFIPGLNLYERTLRVVRAGPPLDYTEDTDVTTEMAVTAGLEHASEPGDICEACTDVLGGPSPCAITHDFAPGAYDGAPQSWRPKVGDHVRTVDPLTSTAHFSDTRRPGAAGQLIVRVYNHDRRWWVRHDDGTEAPYDEDELRPAGAP